MSDGAPAAASPHAAPGAPAEDPQRRRALGVAFLTLFLDLLGFGIIIPIQPFYAESFGAAPAVVTLLGASYSLMQFIFAPLWGRWSDRIGRRPVVLISVAFSAAGFLAFGLAHSLLMLFVARMIAGFGNANLGTVQALVADVTPGAQRAKAMGMMGAAFGLGFVFGPVIGGLVGSAWGPAAPAFVSAAFAGLNWLLAFFLLPETRRPGVAGGGAHGFLGLRALGQARAFVNVPRLLVIILVFTTGFALMETALALFIEHEFVSRDLLGSEAGHKQATRLTTWVLLAVGITAVVVQGGLIGPLRKKLGEKALILGGAFLCAVSFVGIALSPTYALLFGPIVVLSVGSGVFSPSQSSLLSRSVDVHHQGVMLGLSQSMSALGRIFGPAVSGLLFEQGHGAPFLVGAVLLAAGALVGFGLRAPETTA